MFYSNRKAFTLECIMLINLFTKQKQSHRSRKQTWLSGERERRGNLGDRDWHIHTVIYKTDNQQEAVCTGNSVLSITTYIGKGYIKNEDIYIISIMDSLAVQMKPTTVNQLYSNNIF